MAHPVINLAQHPSSVAPSIPNATVRRYQSGELISSPLKPQDMVLVVTSGRLRVFLSQNGKDITLTYLEPGGVFSTHARTFIEADKESEIQTLSSMAFAQSLADNPTQAMATFAVLGKTLGACIDMIENLAFRSVEERVAHRFVRLVGDEMRRGAVVEVDLTGEQMGWLVGSSRQAVSTAIGRLCERGVIARRSRTQYEIRDDHALKQMLDSSGQLSSG